MKIGIGIIVGGKTRGSNMAAIARAARLGEIEANVKVVIAPEPEARAAILAAENDLNVSIVPPGDAYGQRLLTALRDCNIVCLAGFMRLLPSEVLSAFEGRILNIHPALLPKFGGKGMYGIHVHRAVLAAGEGISGCTVHVVTEHYDEGPVVVQKTCPVLEQDSPESLAERVQSLEHDAYIEAIRALASRLGFETTTQK